MSTSPFSTLENLKRLAEKTTQEGKIRADATRKEMEEMDALEDDLERLQRLRDNGGDIFGSD